MRFYFLASLLFPSFSVVFGINVDVDESVSSAGELSQNGLFAELVIEDGACISNPCLNDGLCVASKDGFVCICIDGHLGRYCERKADECPSDAANEKECLNNGLCKLDVDGMPTCHCDDGYHGERCQFEIDHCHDNPCLNNGVCNARDHGYQCRCPDGYTGKNCQLKTQTLESCLRAKPSGGRQWSDIPSTVTVRWGYDSNLTCNSFDTCFGLQITDVNHTTPGYIDVQLLPVQLQPHDVLVLKVNDESELALDQFKPHLLDSEVPFQSFHECDFTNAKLITSSLDGVQLDGSVYRINASSLLTTGNNYFAADVNIFLQCKFGLRLNVTVKEASCSSSLSSNGNDKICHGVGRCETNYSKASYECTCCPGYSGEFCDFEDPCYTNPCLNGGQCTGDERTGLYTCHCSLGFEGRRCGDIVNHCSVNPCLNGSSCSSMLSGFVCNCMPGFTGVTCDTIIDKCSPDPCHNGAICHNEQDAFRCQCQPGYQGSLCEVDIDECSSDPCLNGACLDGVNAYRCHCKAGYTGHRCESKLNLCHSNPCINGQCINTRHGFECSCGNAYIGRLCEIKLDLCSLKEFCVIEHASKCIDNGMDASCTCKHGYEGVNCAVNIDDCAVASCPTNSYCIDKIGGFECICKDSGKADGDCNVERGDRLDQLPVIDKHNIINANTKNKYDHVEIEFVSNDCYRLQQQSSLRGLRSAISSCIRQACKCNYDERNVLFDVGSVACFDSVNGQITTQLATNDHVGSSRLHCHLRACLDASASAQLGFGSVQTKPLVECQSVPYFSSTVDVPPMTESSQGIGLDILIAMLTTLCGSIVLSIGLFVCWRRRVASRVADRQESSIPAPKRKRTVAFSGEFDKVQVKRPCRTTKVKRLSVNPTRKQYATKASGSLARCTGSEAH